MTDGPWTLSSSQPAARLSPTADGLQQPTEALRLRPEPWGLSGYVDMGTSTAR